MGNLLVPVCVRVYVRTYAYYVHGDNSSPLSVCPAVHIYLFSSRRLHREARKKEEKLILMDPAEANLLFLLASYGSIFVVMKGSSSLPDRPFHNIGSPKSVAHHSWMNYIEFADLRILRLKNCEKAGWVFLPVKRGLVTIFEGIASESSGFLRPFFSFFFLFILLK